MDKNPVFIRKCGHLCIDVKHDQAPSEIELKFSDTKCCACAASEGGDDSVDRWCDVCKGRGLIG